MSTTEILQELRGCFSAGQKCTDLNVRFHMFSGELPQISILGRATASSPSDITLKLHFTPNPLKYLGLHL